MNRDVLHKLRYVFRIVFIILLVALVIYAILDFVPNVLDLLKDGDEAKLQAYLEDAGRAGIFVLVALQVLQTITIVFPGIPIYMCSGIVYGKLKGTLICYLTYVISNCIIFVLSRRMGEAADELFPNKKERAIVEMIERTKHPNVLVGVLCVLPVIPNGIIPHIAAKSRLDFKGFLTSVAIGCAPGVFLFVFCGNLLLAGHYEVIIVLLVLAVVSGISFVIFRDKIMGWIDETFTK